MGEKRRYMRFNMLLNGICRRSGISKKLTISDFSKEGVGIKSGEVLSEGEDVEVEMMIPGDNIPVVVAGQIAWTNEVEQDDGTYKSGMKFKRVSGEDKSRILEYIYQNWIIPAENK